MPVIDLGPDEEGHGDDRGGETDLHGQRRARGAGSRPSVLSATNIAPWVRNSSRVVSAAEQRVGVEQVEEAADVLLVGVDRHAAQDVGEGDAPQQRRHERADEDREVPAGAASAASSRLARYSKARPRTISATRISSSGR